MGWHGAPQPLTRFWGGFGETGTGGDVGTTYLSPPRIRAVFRPVNLPSCGVRKKHVEGVIKTKLSCPPGSPHSPPRCCPPYLLGELEGLQGQLAGGREDEGARPGLTGGLQPLEHGDEEAGRLPAARPRHRHHVPAAQDGGDALRDIASPSPSHRHRTGTGVPPPPPPSPPSPPRAHLPLDGGGHLVALLHDALEDGVAEACGDGDG